MSKIANIKWNDTANGPGIGVSVYVQGCPHHCVGCWNPETWSFEGGFEAPRDIRDQIIKGLSANGVKRCLNILGGEPLCKQNRDLVNEIVTAVRTAYPDIKIYLWSGYTYQDLLSMNSPVVISILEKCDVLIDGRFELENRDITLKLRGSSNQNIIDLEGKF